MKKVIEVWFKNGSKKKFILVLKKGFFSGEKWHVAEAGFWGPKKIGEARTFDDALAIIAMKYGKIKHVKFK